MNNYFDELKICKLYDILRNQIKIPLYLYAKILINLYTLESKFYNDLNCSLINEQFSVFKQFIFILYYALDLKIIKSVNDKYLYRSDIISVETYEKILNFFENYKNEMNDEKIIVLTNSFLNFSRRLDVAEKDLNSSLKKFKIDNYKDILFVVNPLKEKINYTNIDSKEISIYPNEDDVIFLPFSGFEICGIEKKENYSIISLNYLNKYEKKVIDYLDARSKDKVDEFLQKLIQESNNTIFKNIFSPESLRLFINNKDKKTVLLLDQYCRCKIYDNYLNNFSEQLTNFYFEKATTVKEAYNVLSNYEFNFIYIIINDKLSKEFLKKYEEIIKKLGVVTANIIFCDEKLKIKNGCMNNPFLNPGKVVTDFSKVVEYLNKDEFGFNNILRLNKTIDRSFTGEKYGYIFKEINENQIDIPMKIIEKIILNLPNKNSINEFKNFIFKYGNKSLSKAVNPSLEKKIELPLCMYPKYYMKMYGLETYFYKDMNKYLSNRENDFGKYDTFITIILYGLKENILINSNDCPLFRGGVISKKECENLERDHESKLYSCKNFLSFSKSEKQADKFLKNNLDCDTNLLPVKFIIKKYEIIKEENNEININSNVEMRHYSGFVKEQEVLFLPLSSFKIKDIKDSTFSGKQN